VSHLASSRGAPPPPAVAVASAATVTSSALTRAALWVCSASAPGRPASAIAATAAEQTFEKIALRFHAVTKGRGRLVVLLLHRNDVLIGVSHGCVSRVLREESVNGISVCTDGISLTSESAFQRVGEGHLGVVG